MSVWVNLLLNSEPEIQKPVKKTILPYCLLYKYYLNKDVQAMPKLY